MEERDINEELWTSLDSETIDVDELTEEEMERLLREEGW